jgi:6-phosphogluconate dehydrogenase (decarboxylating)
MEIVNKIGFIGLGRMGSNMVFNLLDKKYQATDQTITDVERERLGELLRIKMSKGNLDLSEENEFLNLNRKMKGNG